MAKGFLGAEPKLTSSGGGSAVFLGPTSTAISRGGAATHAVATPPAAPALLAPAPPWWKRCSTVTGSPGRLGGGGLQSKPSPGEGCGFEARLRARRG